MSNSVIAIHMNSACALEMAHRVALDTAVAIGNTILLTAAASVLTADQNACLVLVAWNIQRWVGCEEVCWSQVDFM